MANKTLLVKGLTPTTVGAAATEGVKDITEKVYGRVPTLNTPVVTKQLFSSLIGANPVVREGKVKITMKRKRHIHENATTAAIHDANGKIGASIGAVSTANFDTLKFDTFEWTLDKSWELALIVDKKKDPKTREEFIYDGVAEEIADKQEKQAALFWKSFNDDIDGTTKKSTLYPTYVDTIDAKTKASPVLTKEIDISSGTDDVKKAADMIDAMFKLGTELKLMGRVNSDFAGYPYCRGTLVARSQKVFVVKEEFIPILSKDARYVPVGKGMEIIMNGQVGMINNIPVITDEVFETTSTQDATLLIKGSFSPVAIAEELADNIAVVDHPTKPTRSFLVEGAGAYDSMVLPYINLTRSLTFKTV